MDKLKNILIHAVSRVRIIGICGLLFVLVGIIVMCSTSSSEDKQCSFQRNITIDYTYCKDALDENQIATCREVIQTHTMCTCYVKFNITEDFPGDIAVYYELETFNQSETAKEANYYQSRDDNQLRGELSMNVSEACGNYSYHPNGRPIAPCGAIADTMFTDDAFDIIPPQAHIPIVPKTLTGLIPEEVSSRKPQPRNKSETDAVTIIPSIKEISSVPKKLQGETPEENKVRFQNPEPRDKLETAFQNFSKPIHWYYDIWRLDTDPANNGFENIRFIGWMMSEWRRKPLWRVDRTIRDEFKDGLPAGLYELKVEYMYPISLYDGPRKVILAKPYSFSGEPECTTTEVSSPGFTIGVILLVIGVTLLLLTAISKLYERQKAQANTQPAEAEGADCLFKENRT